MLKKALLVSPYFIPSNLAGVQRVRLLSSTLAQFGWEPLVLTVHPQCYEEGIDLASMHLLHDTLRVERVKAWPASICRRFGIGDLSLRAHIALRRRIEQLMHSNRPDLLFVTVLPGYSSLLGSWAKQRFGLPFVLDYQDPWVPKCANPSKWSKASVAQRLAERIESKVLPHVDALTAVSDETLDTLRDRHLIPRGIATETIPIGADRHDHMVAGQYGRSCIKRNREEFHIAYLGTLTARMLPALEALLHSISRVATIAKVPEVHLHLIGSSAQPAGRDQHGLEAMAAKAGLSDRVHLHPARIGYLDALRTMQDADLLLLLGSTDSHYTASKLFPYWLSGKPILGLFHEMSTVVSLSRDLGGVSLILYSSKNPPQDHVEQTAELLRAIVQGTHSFPARNEQSFQPYSAEGIAQRYAELFDRVCSG